MGIITLAQPSAGQNIAASLHATNYGALQVLLNGNLEPVNLKGAPGLVSGEVPVWDGTQFVRSSATKVGASSLGTGTPSSSNFLRGDGSWQPIATGNLLGVRLFTTSGTYTPTSGTTKVFVECWGGGGGGGGVDGQGAFNQAMGGGGSGGNYAAKFMTSGFSGASYTIGAGGGSDANGGTTSLTGGPSATGGGAGVHGTNNAGSGPAGGAALGGSTGDYTLYGGWGEHGTDANVVWGGRGGEAPIIGGGGVYGAAIVRQSGGAVNGNGSGILGGGGGGAVASAAGSSIGGASGGSGAGGAIRIWEFA